MISLLVIGCDARTTKVVLAHGRRVACQVFVEPDPLLGLVKAAQVSPDLVIVSAAFCNGSGLLPALRRASVARVLAVAGDSVARASASGADDVASAPLAEADLRRCLRSIETGASSSQDGRLLRRGQVALNLDLRVVRVASRPPVSLTEREFLFLLELMSHAPDTRSREQLLKAVWGVQFETGTNRVEVCVSRLRSKLALPVLETVRGDGYRFVGAPGGLVLPAPRSAKAERRTGASSRRRSSDS